MLLSWRKIWNGSKRGEFSPSKWQSYVRFDGVMRICVGSVMIAACFLKHERDWSCFSEEMDAAHSILQKGLVGEM